MSLALLHSVSSGELLAAEIQVSPKLLEEILEALASAPFPINPELDHPLGGMSRVRFPLYESQLEILRDILAASGFGASLLKTQPMSTDLGSSYEATL